MNKILNWIYNNIKWINEYLIKVNVVDSSKKLYMLRLGEQESGFFLELSKFLWAIITIIVFLIMYKYDIQLISNEYIKYIKVYLAIILNIYLYMIIYYIIRGIGNYKSKSMLKGITLIIKLINFIINAFIIYWLLNLNIELFLQYNIIWLIELSRLCIFLVYKNMLDYEINGVEDSVVSFLNYPWIILLIIVILLRRENNFIWLIAYIRNDGFAYVFRG